MVRLGGGLLPILLSGIAGYWVGYIGSVEAVFLGLLPMLNLLFVLVAIMPTPLPLFAAGAQRP